MVAEHYLFVQVIHIDPTYAEYVTLIPSLFTDGETDAWRKVHYSDYVYSGVLPVFESERRRKTKWVGNAPIPEFAKVLPKLREQRWVLTDDGLHCEWTIRDGERRVKVARLSPDQEPLQMVALESTETFIPRALHALCPDVFPTSVSTSSLIDTRDHSQSVRYFVYFSDKGMAGLFARAFESPFQCDIAEIADDEWRVTVSVKFNPDDGDASAAGEEVMEQASRYNGEYDGHVISTCASNEIQN